MTDLRYAHILSFVLEHPWAITRPMLQTIAAIVSRRAAGIHATTDEIHAALVNRKALPQPDGGGVAIIPVYGVLAPRANMMSDMSGGTSFDVLTSLVRQALGTSTVSTIVLDVDSPGGSVAGATEFAREVLKARAKKPVIAHANFLMASAAYWLSSCATEIVASPSASVGSIGVLTIHEDLSKSMEMDGIKDTYIAAGKYKTEGNEAEPLSSEAAAFMQHRVDEAYAQFVADISRGRGVPIADVRGGYGQGRTFSAQEALSLGMIDKIATFDDTLARVMAGNTPAARAARQIDVPLDTAQEPAAVTAQDRARDFDQQRTALALLDL